MTAPDLKLRRLIWDDGRPSIDPEDYEVIDARGERVGRLYRSDAVGGGYAWRWSVYGLAVTNHPPAGGAHAGSRAGGVQSSVGNVPAARAGGLSMQPFADRRPPVAQPRKIKHPELPFSRTQSRR
jgi:hypothetical protein